MLACLYDVHGNLPALEAVLDDARASGAKRWVLGGDYALMGAWPAECMRKLLELDGGTLWIRGNTDRWIAEPDSAPDDEALRSAIAFSRAALGEEFVRLLGLLPPDGRYDDDTLICHASPGSDMRGFAPAASDEDAVLLTGAPETRIVFGHTHIQFRREAQGVDLVNPGSIGIPFDGDHRAAYAVIDDDGTVELRRVAYDHEASAAAAEAHGGAWSKLAAARIRSASMAA